MMFNTFTAFNALPKAPMYLNIIGIIDDDSYHEAVKAYEVYRTIMPRLVRLAETLHISPQSINVSFNIYCGEESLLENDRYLPIHQNSDAFGIMVTAITIHIWKATGIIPFVKYAADLNGGTFYISSWKSDENDETAFNEKLEDIRRECAVISPLIEKMTVSYDNEGEVQFKVCVLDPNTDFNNAVIAAMNSRESEEVYNRFCADINHRAKVIFRGILPFNIEEHDEDPFSIETNYLLCENSQGVFIEYHIDLAPHEAGLIDNEMIKEFEDTLCEDFIVSAMTTLYFSNSTNAIGSDVFVKTYSPTDSGNNNP